MGSSDSKTQSGVRLRKCPACHELVGAASAWCPRCGKNFRAAIARRIILWIGSFAILGWLLLHYVLKLI